MNIQYLPLSSVSKTRKGLIVWEEEGLYLDYLLLGLYCKQRAAKQLGKGLPKTTYILQVYYEQPFFLYNL